MLETDRQRIAADLKRGMLEGRELAKRELQAAQSAGKTKDAKLWAGNLRKTEALIAKYGLDANAHRT